jgi:hyperosmotically inducible protein
VSTASQLTVDAEKGDVTVVGTVPTQEQLSKIPTLAQEIKGVKSVKVNGKVAPAQAAPNKQ